jgi:tellurite resistance protein TerC
VVEVPLWAWGAFVAFVLSMLAIDLLVFQREAHVVRVKEAAMWVGIWVTLALAFGLVIWLWMGPTRAGEYYAGYIVEWALSVDNMFVFALLFSYFVLPRELQHRVLFWGILGALVFRVIFILAGAALLERFDWMVFVFGGFLVLTGVRMGFHQTENVHPERNVVLRGLRRVMPMTSDYRGQKFFVRDAGRLVATPLLAVLVAVETTDIIFAVDSIPAIFGVTRVPFIVFSSNAFAILGLRALFFVLAGMIGRFRYLNEGLALVLVFIGAKMILHDWVHIPIWMSLAVIGTVLALAIGVSLFVERRTIARALKANPPADDAPPMPSPPDDDQSSENTSSDH